MVLISLQSTVVFKLNNVKLFLDNFPLLSECYFGNKMNSHLTLSMVSNECYFGNKMNSHLK